MTVVVLPREMTARDHVVSRDQLATGIFEVFISDIK